MEHLKAVVVGPPLWWLASALVLATWSVDGVAETRVRGARFDAATDAPSPDADQALVAARQLAAHFATVPNMRATAPRGSWSIDPGAVWSVRDEPSCVRDLAAQDIGAVLLRHPLTKMPAPVVLTTTVDGVTFRNAHGGGPLLYACELAARLPVLAEVVRRQGVHTVDVLCAFRLEPDTSFHSVGLGLDIVSFQTDRGELSVLDHFVETTDAETCSAPRPEGWRARALLDIACDLAATHQFSTVITPNYRRGHRDHFHIDARPDDPRFYVR